MVYKPVSNTNSKLPNPTDDFDFLLPPVIIKCGTLLDRLLAVVLLVVAQWPQPTRFLPLMAVEHQTVNFIARANKIHDTYNSHNNSHDAHMQQPEKH